MKHYMFNQIIALRQIVNIASQSNLISNIRDWMIIDLLTQTDLKISEIINLKCGDLKFDYFQLIICIRNNKKLLPRYIQISEELQNHFEEFLKWKQDRGESIGPDDHVFIGQRGPWTSQAIQQIVKKYLKLLKIYKKGKSIKALRYYSKFIYEIKLEREEIEKCENKLKIKNSLINLKRSIKEEIKT